MTRPFRVGEWLVEPDLNRLSRKGCTVPVEPKVIRVLECLADHPGEVLSKEKILRSVWPDTYVSDGILTYSITALRKAFQDDARNPRVIQTIARKGYRLIAPVADRQSGPVLPSIAVLAFSDLSAQRDQEYFCDGIAAEIIGSLARLKGLRVASRTSSFAFKTKSEDVRSIGRKLGVDTILEGNIQKAGNLLRITAQLIDVEDGYQLFSERYERELKDVFAIQDEISRSIAAILRVTLSVQESRRLGKPPTTDVRAYDYNLRGRQFFYQYRRKGMEFALKMFSQAIDLDPGYARAYAGIADCCSFLYMYAGSHEVHRRQADEASLKALSLDPESAEAHAARGVALSLQGNHREAEEALENAIRLDPLLFEAYYFYARYSFAQGKLEKAVDLYRRASEISPHDYQARLLVAQILDDLGHHDEADASRRLGIRAAEARLNLNPDDVRALYMGANGLVALGEYEKGLEWAAMALEMDPAEPMVLYNVACIQALAGRHEDAIATLEQAVRSGLTQKDWLEHDSNLAPLRSKPQYRALIDILSAGATDPHAGS